MAEQADLEHSKDYYLQDRTRLNGQPKRTIGDYVESNGILVPRRFETFEEAIRFKGDVLARSEHPQDYDGGSGVFSSCWIGKGSAVKSLEDLYCKVIPKNMFGEFLGGGHEIYCEYAGIDVKEFCKSLSFSFWEEIPGLNYLIVADSSVEGRYHIRASNGKLEGGRHGYGLYEKGKLIAQGGKPTPGTLSRKSRSYAERLVEMYETVRRLEHFDPNHCPIIEAQIHMGDIYFLQYHGCREFSPANFTLLPRQEKHRVPLSFVRGASGPEGMVLDSIILRAWTVDPEENLKDLYKREAQISGDCLHQMFAEFMSRRWKLYLEPSEPWKVFGHLSD